jgi:hypothetical protein
MHASCYVDCCYVGRCLSDEFKLWEYAQSTACCVLQQSLCSTPKGVQSDAACVFMGQHWCSGSGYQHKTADTWWLAGGIVTGLKVPAPISCLHDSCGFVKWAGFPHGSRTGPELSSPFLHQEAYILSAVSPHLQIAQGGGSPCFFRIVVPCCANSACCTCMFVWCAVSFCSEVYQQWVSCAWHAGDQSRLCWLAHISGHVQLAGVCRGNCRCFCL